MKKTLTHSKNFSNQDFSYPSIYLGSNRSLNNSNIEGIIVGKSIYDGDVKIIELAKEI